MGLATPLVSRLARNLLPFTFISSDWLVIECSAHQIIKINQIAATAQASLLKPLRTLSLAAVGILCSLALTAQNTARQQSDAETHVASKSKTIIFMNLARGIRPWESTEMRADK